MTTTVKVEAHCASNKEVVVEVIEAKAATQAVVIQDGEKYECYAYDDRQIVVREREKPAVQAD